MDEATVNAVARRLAAANRVLFVTGAGISADSGLPTYRGIGGLYEGNATDHGMSIEEALSGATFRRQPALTWKHILDIETACRGASFNPAHEAIARIEAQLPEVWVLTQNVDGFHQAAGSRKVIEIHGNIHRLDCTVCSFRNESPDYSAMSGLPQCPRCGNVVRPAVVLFGEELPTSALLQLQTQVSRGFDLVVMVGTTALFPYIVEPALRARQAGVPTVEINPAESEISALVDYRFAARSAEALPRLCERFQCLV